MSAAAAASCPGNSDAIGVSRTLAVSAKDYARLGHIQYRRSLPLDDHEVVLTFDDGPIPPYTDRVLDILARNCVKATFFLVGRHTAANPAAARRVLAAGHTIGNHSQNHPLHFEEISENHAEQEIDKGYRTLTAALGPDTVAPFFRIPGLGRTHRVEDFAKAQSLIVWSADAVADDWTPINSGQVLHRALSRLEARGKGILLLHDIQPRTVLMLPALLAELKRRHFRIVHVVPDRGVEPAPPPVPSVDVEVAAKDGDQIGPAVPDKLGWPRVILTSGVGSEAEPIPLPLRRQLRLRHRHARTAAVVVTADPVSVSISY
ncbi:MAG: polysaccharide deacetylase family protein [Pseudolabrys sp.]